MPIVLYDTNVLMDVLLDRQQFIAASSQAWALASRKQVDGRVAAITLNNLNYLVRRELRDRQRARDAVELVLDSFDVVPVDRAVLEAAVLASHERFRGRDPARLRGAGCGRPDRYAESEALSAHPHSHRFAGGVAANYCLLSWTLIAPPCPAAPPRPSSTPTSTPGSCSSRPLDVMLTWVILHLGGREANGAAAFIIGRFGLPGMVIFKFGLVAFVIALCEAVGRRSPAAGERLAVWAIALTCVPVILAGILIAR